MGAGPAGLTAALELTGSSAPCLVLESEAAVGGLSKTIEYSGYRFDIGGHRFYTKVSVIRKLWEEVLGDDLLTRPRLSRIYFNGRYFDYPLKAGNVLSNLGFLEAVRCIASYAKARLFPVRPEDSLEDWVINRFGERLYAMFFKSYTEKVWGIPCRNVDSAWAAQRIRGLSLTSAAIAALLPNRGRPAAKTLINSFQYPRLGPGMLWDRVADIVRGQGGEVKLNSPVTRIHWTPGRILGVEAAGRYYPVEHLLSSMPIRDLIRRMDPAPPEYLREAADMFHYRDFLMVALVLPVREVFPDNWIYIHEPSVRVGRIQNFKNWSQEMVPSAEMTCLGMEYFCFEGDGLWSMSDQELVRMASEELARLGLCGETPLDGAVIRTPKAYPVYDDSYRRGLDAIRRFLSETPNLQLIGRNGMHHYNNQDHSMLTGLLAARNILGASYDLWRVNADESFLEDDGVISVAELEALRAGQPAVPVAVANRMHR
jgi:protoporphyrinogen oxidase